MVCVVGLWPVLLSWRGHVESVSAIDLVEQNKVLLTSSCDCTVRMWTTEGHYIGETSLMRVVAVVLWVDHRGTRHR